MVEVRGINKLGTSFEWESRWYVHLDSNGADQNVANKQENNAFRRYSCPATHDSQRIL